MTSLLFIGNPPQTRGGIIQVREHPPQIRRNPRRDKNIPRWDYKPTGERDCGVGGGGGGSEKSSAGVGGLVKTPPDCTVASIITTEPYK